MRMMNKKAILLFLGTVTLGCAASTSAQTLRCPPLTNLVLSVGEYHLSLNDKRPICVTSPGTFQIMINEIGNPEEPITMGAATVEAKASNGVTIKGNNGAAVGKITVDVGPGGEPDQIISFWIKVDKVGILDPKVRVIPSFEFLSLQSEVFYDTLDTLGLTLEEARKLVPPRAESE